MRTTRQPKPGEETRAAAAARTVRRSRPSGRGELTPIGGTPGGTAGLASSPRVAVQRKQLQAAFGSVIQRKPPLGYDEVPELDDPWAPPPGYDVVPELDDPWAPPPGYDLVPDLVPDRAVTAPTAKLEQLPVRLGPHAGSAAADSGSFPTKALPPKYANEQQDASFRGKVSGWQKALDKAARKEKAPRPMQIGQLSTRYMTEAEQASRKVGFTQSPQGSLLAGPNGTLLDTAAASGFGTQHSAGKGKHIFAMTGAGELRAVDPWAEHQVTPMENDEEKGNLRFVNHSSLLAGGAAASAGELTVREGRLEQVSDSSGHYTPDGGMVKSALDQFGTEGVDLSKVDVKLVGKNEGERPVIGPSHEFLSHKPDEAETRMRQWRKTQADLISKVAAPLEAGSEIGEGFTENPTVKLFREEKVQHAAEAKATSERESEAAEAELAAEDDDQHDEETGYAQDGDQFYEETGDEEGYLGEP